MEESDASRLGFDVFAAVTLALTAAAGAYTPVVLAARDRSAGGSGRSTAYVLGNLFSAGVMVSAGFCHLLGEAVRQMPPWRFPLAPFLCGAGYLMTLVADSVASSAAAHGGGGGSGGGGHSGSSGGCCPPGGGGGANGGAPPPLLRARSGPLYSLGAGDDDDAPHTPVEVLAAVDLAELGSVGSGLGSGATPRKRGGGGGGGGGGADDDDRALLPKPGGGGGGGFSSLEVDLSRAAAAAGTPLDAPAPPGAGALAGGSPRGGGGAARPPPPAQVSFLTAALMGVALCFHSLLEGAALGAQETVANSLHIFIAIAAHKGLAAYALGSSVVDANVSARRFLSVIAPFTLASPVGIFLGFIVSDLARGTGAASISALASGTFLYVAFMEVIPKELRGSAPGRAAPKLGALLAGFGAMSLLAVWA